jgi:hypothetical protein
MKLQLSQKELENFVNQGKTAIWQYNTLYQIEFSRNIGSGEYYLRKVLQKSVKSAIGVTLRGRFIAMTPTEAQRYIN